MGGQDLDSGRPKPRHLGAPLAEQGLAFDPEHCVFLISFFKIAHRIAMWSSSVGRPARLKGPRDFSFCARNIPP